MARTSKDPAPIPPETGSSTATEGRAFWELSEKIRPELRVPGFWDALQQNCNQWAQELTISPFWRAIKDRQPRWSNDFQRKTSGALLAAPNIPDLVPKGTKRVREKLLHDWLRKKSPRDVSSYWPIEGPPVPLLITDLVRARIECQYLDGVEFLASRVSELAAELGISCERERQGRLQGYFAQHLWFHQKVIFRFGGGEELITIMCEVQIATALATRVWEAAHPIYEVWRVQTDEPEEWQWNPSDPRFTARQLGHMIHLADGLLVQLRNSSQQQT